MVLLKRFAIAIDDVRYAVGSEFHAIIAQCGDDFGEQRVLLLEHARGDGGVIVVGEDGDDGLGDYFALVKLFVDEMDGRPGETRAGIYDCFVDVFSVHAFSAKCREQGGMNVEHAVFIRSTELRRDES